MIEPLLPTWVWVLVVMAAIVGLLVLGLVALTRIVAGRVTKAFPPEGRFVEVNGHRLHYTDSADVDPTDRDRPALLLVHGLGGQLRNLTHSLEAALQEKGRDRRIVVLDRAGAGRSTRAPGSDHGLPAQAADIAAFIEALGLERPVVVGHSLGGAIALALGLDHPERVAGLVLVAPLTAPVEDPPELFRPLMFRNDLSRRVTSHTLATPIGMRTGPAALATVFHPEAPPADFATRGGGLLGLRPAAFQNTSRDMTALPDHLPAQHARYGELRESPAVPVAVICGTADEITPTETQSVAFAQRTGAVLELVEGGGHMIPVTRPKEVAAFVLRHALAWQDGATSKAEAREAAE